MIKIGTILQVKDIQVKIANIYATKSELLHEWGVMYAIEGINNSMAIDIPADKVHESIEKGFYTIVNQ